MSFQIFLKLVEIQTKVASIVPLSLGTIYALYRFNKFNFKNFIILFISILTFDMVTTAINNYYDYKRAIKTKGYNYETHNAIVGHGLSERTVVSTIFILLAIATVFGILLYLNTDIIILLLGLTSFGIGVLYSFGPLPISRTPLGEMFSGFFMGFIILFISTYVHIYDLNIVSLTYNDGFIDMRINVLEIAYIFLISIPTIIGIANIMLANNICDMEDDIENNRYTLPIYLGKDKALQLFKWLYYFAYVDIMLLVIFKIVPIAFLILLLTLIIVNKNIRVFYNKQSKKETFILAVANFLIMSISYIIVLSISTTLNYIS